MVGLWHAVCMSHHKGRTLVNNKQKLLWTVVSLLALLIFAAIAIPNLLKSRIAANKASFIGRSRLEDKQDESEQKLVKVGFAEPAEKKLIRIGELALVVSDIHQTAGRIQRLVEAS